MDHDFHCGLIINLFLLGLISHTSFHTVSFFQTYFNLLDDSQWTIARPSLINTLQFSNLVFLPLHEGQLRGSQGRWAQFSSGSLLWWWIEAGKLPRLVCMLKVLLAGVCWRSKCSSLLWARANSLQWHELTIEAYSTDFNHRLDSLFFKP